MWLKKSMSEKGGISTILSEEGGNRGQGGHRHNHDDPAGEADVEKVEEASTEQRRKRPLFCDGGFVHVVDAEQAQISVHETTPPHERVLFNGRNGI